MLDAGDLEGLTVAPVPMASRRPAEDRASVREAEGGALDRQAREEGVDLPRQEGAAADFSHPPMAGRLEQRMERLPSFP